MTMGCSTSKNTIYANIEHDELRLEIFGNKYLYEYILTFVFLDKQTISNFQQTCNANRSGIGEKINE